MCLLCPSMAGIMHLPHNQLRYLQVELENQSSRLEYKTSTSAALCASLFLLVPPLIYPHLCSFFLYYNQKQQRKMNGKTV